MRRRRLVAMIGLTAASGGLLVACAGRAGVNLPSASAALQLGPLPFRMPTLQPPTIGAADRPFVDRQATVNATASQPVSNTTTDKASEQVAAGTFATSPCDGGH